MLPNTEFKPVQSFFEDVMLAITATITPKPFAISPKFLLSSDISFSSNALKKPSPNETVVSLFIFSNSVLSLSAIAPVLSVTIPTDSAKSFICSSYALAPSVADTNTDAALEPVNLLILPIYSTCFPAAFACLPSSYILRITSSIDAVSTSIPNASNALAASPPNCLASPNLTVSCLIACVILSASSPPFIAAACKNDNCSVAIPNEFAKVYVSAARPSAAVDNCFIAFITAAPANTPANFVPSAVNCLSNLFVVLVTLASTAFLPALVLSFIPTWTSPVPNNLAMLGFLFMLFVFSMSNEWIYFIYCSPNWIWHLFYTWI